MVMDKVRQDKIKGAERDNDELICLTSQKNPGSTV